MSFQGYTLFDLCLRIQDLEWVTALRESIWVFPSIETCHVLGLILSVGTVIWYDLRIAGFALKKLTVSEVSSQILPWGIGGFILMFSTGALLLLANTVKLYGNFFFRMKLILLVLAGCNALIFHLTIYRKRIDWDQDETPPFQARLAGVASLILWGAIIGAGRMTAFSL